MATIPELIEKANKTYRLNLTSEQQARVRTSLRIAGFANTVEGSDVHLVVDIIKERAKAVTASTSKKSPLVATAESNEKCSFDKCPICNNPMKPVKIHGGREALYCKEHKVSMPVYSEEE
jgi:hypothetical protein